MTVQSIVPVTLPVIIWFSSRFIFDDACHRNATFTLLIVTAVVWSTYIRDTSQYPCGYVYNSPRPNHQHKYLLCWHWMESFYASSWPKFWIPLSVANSVWQNILGTESSYGICHINKLTTCIKQKQITTNKNLTVYSKTCLERPLHRPQKCGLGRQVVSGDRFNYIEM